MCRENGKWIWSQYTTYMYDNEAIKSTLILGLNILSIDFAVHEEN